MKYLHTHVWLNASIFLILSLMFSLWLISPHSLMAQDDWDNDGVPDSDENQLALKYAPYLHFAAGEKFFPTDVSYHIDNSVLFLKSDDSNILVDSSPTIVSISLYQGGDYFLNDTLGGFEEIAEDYGQKKESLGYTVYARVTKSMEHFVVQYWFFYAFNPGTLNHHQGDWEMVEIILDSEETPLYATYSQHFSGEKAFWSNVEKVDETHPRVYAALGSHANYFRPYQGKLGLENDIVGDAFTLEPDDFQMILLGEKGAGNHPSSQDWLDYGGKWGNWAQLADISRGAAGPRGPGYGENEDKWFGPVSWGSDVFVVNQNWFRLSWITYHFLYIFSGIIAALTVIKLWRIAKRKRQGKLNLMKILRSKAGVGVVLGVVGVAIYLVAILLPWYVVRGNIQTVALETVGEVDLVLVDGVNGVRVNLLQGDQGLAQLFGLGIPLGIILLSSVVLNILDLIGVEKPKSLSRTYLMSGVTSLIPVIIIVVFITQLAGLITPFANAVGGGVTIPPLVDEMAREISSSPLIGDYSGALDSYGNLYVSWGLGIGSYLFIAAAITKLAAGIIVRKAVFAEKPKEKVEIIEEEKIEKS
ncbi:Vps62-related protein [Candidatus Bathyarchaeota archaeon]|nr:Vps62-related protein [Candidatus Bathyarchaeota archaeon]